MKLLMPNDEQLACRLSAEEGLKVLNEPTPDFPRFEDVLQPLINSEQYSSKIKKLYKELLSESFSIDDAIEILERIYDELI